MGRLSETQRAVLVTGGAGYIGSHTAKALADAGWRPVIFDNLSSGHRKALLWGEFVHGDVRDGAALREVMKRFSIGAVIHFAGLIEVGLSMTRPDTFYDHNLAGTATLLAAMRDCDVPRLVFSSSAAVYGSSKDGSLLPLKEDAPKSPSSPYGETKLAAERMIAAYCDAFGLTGVALRYFNAAGADPSGLIGEAHQPESHLIPRAIAAGLGLEKRLTVFGDDFPTPDGSCLRDYVHVCDLAAAHVAALSTPMEKHAFEAVNLGTGRGRSVLEVIAAVERVLGSPGLADVGARRPGDPPSLVADPSAAARRLGWKPTRSTLENIVVDAVRWHRDPLFGPMRGKLTARSAKTAVAPELTPT